MRNEFSRSIVILISAFATHIFAFPQFASQIRARSAVQFPSASHFEARATNGLLEEVTSIVDAIPTSFNLEPLISVGRKIIPDEEHPFIPPGPTDVRGGCPGLNLLANYGYIPRNGITDMTTLLYASQEGLGLSADLSLVLIALALKTSVDLTTLKMSIGDTDARTDGPLTFLLGRAPGLFSSVTHNKYEVDGSLATDDAFFAGGRTNQFNGSRWASWYQLAETKYKGTMPIAWNADVRFMQYNLCRNTNPQCHWVSIISGNVLVFYLGQAFVPTIMPSAEANGLPGPALVDSVNEFMGIVKQSNGTFVRGHSRLPPGPEGVWYRRTVPLTTLELAALGGSTYGSRKFPVVFGSNDGTLGKWNAAPTQLPNVIAGPTVVCMLLDRILDPSGTRFEGVALTSLTTLLNFVLAPVKSQISCS
ncbi:Chloroperoxidase [Melampsora americana]|nr:Chloroperoxidase [Melampsora americana]